MIFLVGALTGLLTGTAAYLLTPWMSQFTGVESRWLRSRLHVPLAVVAGVGSAALAQGWIDLAAFAALGLACSLLIVIDLAAHRLPDLIVGSAGIMLLVSFGLSAAWHGDWSSAGRAVLAAICVGVGYLLLALISPSGLGLGDVKLAALLGCFLGWQGWSQVLWGTAAAFVLNGVVVAALLIARRVNLHSVVAFGPCIVVGAAIGAASRM